MTVSCLTFTIIIQMSSLISYPLWHVWRGGGNSSIEMLGDRVMIQSLGPGGALGRCRAAPEV